MSLRVVALVASLLNGASPPAPAEGDCSAVIAAATPDPALAKLYLRVADEERALGHPDAARAGYRLAAEHDPGAKRAREALAALCAEEAADPYTAGLRAMEAHRSREALALFEEARRQRDDPALDLLIGICHYELGDDARAAPYLQAATSAPETETQARFFLGLSALRSGAGAAAAVELDRVARSSDLELARAAPELLRLARREGRLSLALLAEGGYDSNVDLAPDGTPLAGLSADVSAGVTGALQVRPFGPEGVFARLGGEYRLQREISAYDLGSAQLALGWRFGRGPRSAEVEYGYEWLALGGAPYLSAHHLEARGRLALDALVLGAGYQARLESFLDPRFTDYSGLRHLADVGAEWRFGAARAWAVRAGYLLGIDAAARPSLAFVEHGPSLGLVATFGAARVGLTGGLTFRGYAEPEPLEAEARRDVYLDGVLVAEWDFAEAWTLRLSGAARQSRSTVPELSSSRLQATVGIACALGAL